MVNSFVNKCMCRGNYICTACRKENKEPEGFVIDNPVPIISHPSPHVQKLIRYIIEKHRPYKHKSGWAWCTQCNDANHGASESQPKWPCDAYALAQAIVQDLEKKYD